MTEPNYAASTSPDSRPISTNVLADTGNENIPADRNFNMGYRASMADPGYAPRTGRIDLFVVITFMLSLIGWIVVLVAQAYAAAAKNSGSDLKELVRILWFGFVVQTILSVIVFKVIIGSRAYDAAYAYGMQVAILSSITCVFAVLGVDRTIYTTNRVLRAVGAGWLILAIVDLLWVIYFTSPPQSLVGRLAMELGDLRGTKKQEESHGKVEKIGRSTDAFAMSPAGGSAPRMSGTPAAALDGGQSQSRSNVVHPWNQQRATYASQSDGGSGVGDATTGAASEPGAVSERRESGKLSGIREPEPEPEPEETLTAEALYDYGGSKDDPNELAFKKGQILHIVDSKGKWWLGKTEDGRRGIMPSNYLRLV